jgi:hypothetical protein
MGNFGHTLAAYKMAVLPSTKSIGKELQQR